MGKESEQTLLQGGHTDGTQIYEKMLNITSHLKCKIKPTYHLTPVKMASINKSTNHKYWQRFGEKGTLAHCWWECRLVQPLWKTVWNFLKRIKMELPFDLGILLLEIYPKNTESPIQQNLCFESFNVNYQMNTFNPRSL